MTTSSVTLYCTISAFLGFMIGGMIQISVAETRAVQHHCAQYDNKTGSFQWLDQLHK